jgi:hypothetical protein
MTHYVETQYINQIKAHAELFGLRQGRGLHTTQPPSKILRVAVLTGPPFKALELGDPENSSLDPSHI